MRMDIIGVWLVKLGGECRCAPLQSNGAPLLDVSSATAALVDAELETWLRRSADSSPQSTAPTAADHLSS